jgi:putative transposase
VVFDRGYSNYAWYKSLNEKGIFYVTRQRSNARYCIIKRRKINRSSGVTSDQIIRFTSDRSQKKALPDVHRIGYYDTETQQHYQFITNHFELSAETIAEIYK